MTTAFASKLLPVLLCCALAGTAHAANDYRVGDRLKPAPAAKAAQFREISWDDLIPADWQPERFLKELKLDSLQDNDPRTLEVMAKIRAEWDNAPVNRQLDGLQVRIPGFVVTLDGDRDKIREFLLVPYFGACVHVPPPPLNQLIHVRPAQPIPAAWSMKPVWVNGSLAVERLDTSMGNAGYRIAAVKVEEYKDPLPGSDPKAPKR